LSYDKDFRDLIQTELGYKVSILTPLLALPSDLPIHLYSTNIGLSLNAIVRDLKPSLESTSTYNDISLDIMLGRYASHPKRLSSTYLIFPVILSLAICLALPAYKAYVEHDMETVRLQNELIIVNQQHQQAKLTDEKAKEIENETNNLYAQLENLRKGQEKLFVNQGEFAGKIRKVVNTMPVQSYFTNINHSLQQITVTGHAENSFQALDYTKILEQEGLFSDTRIQQIGDASGGNVEDAAVTFEIIITNTKMMPPLLITSEASPAKEGK
ncbi:PilN domain-containing protein, partial [Chloroflexota bacterium]